jgi:hypothetical protein
VFEALGHAWRTARGDYREAGYCRLSASVLLLIAFVGGGALLLAISTILALEPV